MPIVGPFLGHTSPTVLGVGGSITCPEPGRTVRRRTRIVRTSFAEPLVSSGWPSPHTRRRPVLITGVSFSQRFTGPLPIRARIAALHERPPRCLPFWSGERPTRLATRAGSSRKAADGRVTSHRPQRRRELPARVPDACFVSPRRRPLRPRYHRIRTWSNSRRCHGSG